MSLSMLCYREKLAKLEWPRRAQSQGIKLRFQLLPEWHWIRGFNYGFLIRVLHLLEGLKYRSKEFLLPQCLRHILVWFFLVIYSRSLNLNKIIYKTVEAKYFTELVPHKLLPIGKINTLIYFTFLKCAHYQAFFMCTKKTTVYFSHAFKLYS